VNLDIFLSHWIVADGNYSDFRAGEEREFALEFYAPTALLKNAKNLKSLEPLPGYKYQIQGEVVFATNNVWVIDSGVFAYSEGVNQVCGGIEQGDFVQGEIYFGVDPFFYFESLWKLDGIPPLIYKWRVDSIEQDTTPLILSESCGSKVYVKDESNRSFGAVEATSDALASDSEIGAEYVLHCTKLTSPAIHQFGRST